jgi:hypothetical protein
VCEALCRSGVLLCANNVVYLKPQEVAEIIMRARVPAFDLDFFGGHDCPS